MFRERLAEISRRIDGAVALSLVDAEGIPVDSISTDPNLDLEILAAELMAQAKAIASDQRELGVGEVQQLAVTTDRLSLIVSAMSAEYFLLLVLRREGNYGRARFELRRARLLLEHDLV